MRLTIVIPVYREGEAARATLEAVAAVAPRPCEILVVHDEADDPTLPVVAALQARVPELRALHNTLGRGPGWALRAGFAAARGEAVCTTMADASDVPEDIGRMLALIEQGFDLVAASRYMPGGRQEGGPWLKRTLSRLAGVSLHALAGLPTRDPTSNFKTYRRTMLEALRLEAAEGFDLALEIAVKAHRAGYRITEIPTVWCDRTAGASSFKLVRWLPRYLRWWRLALRRGDGGRASALRTAL
jgi:glycosyltransferase involved in cell wall biosynthesis